MIEQFYTVMNQDDEYVYRTGNGQGYQGTSFPRATGCAGTEAKGLEKLRKVEESRTEYIKKIRDQYDQWRRGYPGADQDIIDRWKVSRDHRIQEWEDQKYRLVKVTVENA